MIWSTGRGLADSGLLAPFDYYNRGAQQTWAQPEANSHYGNARLHPFPAPIEFGAAIQENRRSPGDPAANRDAGRYII